MSKMRKICIAFSLVIASLGTAQGAPIYNTASYSGGILFVSSIGSALGLQRTNTCGGCAAGSVFGNVLYDTTVEPAGGTGAFVNVALGPVNGASNDLIFQLELGSQPIDLGYDDAGIPGGGGPFIQFNKTGKFNGFAFTDVFAMGGVDYSLSLQGGTFSITRVSDSALAASGYLNIGDAGLTNRTLFVPQDPRDVPEPASGALFGLGLLGLAAARLRRRR